MWTFVESALWWLLLAVLILSLIFFIGFYLRGAFRDRLKSLIFPVTIICDH